MRRGVKSYVSIESTDRWMNGWMDALEHSSGGSLGGSGIELSLFVPLGEQGAEQSSTAMNRNNSLIALSVCVSERAVHAPKTMPIGGAEVCNE